MEKPGKGPRSIEFQGKRFPVKQFRQLFGARPPEIQEQLAFACIGRHELDPRLVLSWITDTGIRDEVSLWCEGRGIMLQEKDGERSSPEGIFSRDEELIQTLGPHIKQVDLARILAIQKYRYATEEVRQTLMYALYRRLNDYLGRRRYFRKNPQVATPIHLPDLPSEIFEDTAISQILLESEREAALPIFNRSEDEGFQFLRDRAGELEEPLLKRFMDELNDYFLRVSTFEVDGFNNKILGSYKDITEVEEQKTFTYPSFHQKEYAYRFSQVKPIPVDLLIGGTGTMKTGASIYAMEAQGMKTTLVVCPASVRLNWVREIQEKYAAPISVRTIESEADFRKATLESQGKDNSRYIILSYSLLSTIKNGESKQLFSQFVQSQGVDSLIADEVHLAKEPDSNCTQQLFTLSSLLPEESPRIAMTATGVVNTVDDLDAPVRILLPYRYSEPGDFTRAARNNPHLVSAILYGEQLMTRWNAEAILGDTLPPTEIKTVPVPMLPFHQAIYEYVYLDDTTEGAVKRGVLRQAALDPALMKKYYTPERIEKSLAGLIERRKAEIDDQQGAILGKRIEAAKERLTAVTGLTSLNEALGELEMAYGDYVRWVVDQDQDARFDEDFLAKSGHENLAIWAFFNFKGGVDQFIQLSPNDQLKSDWEGKKGLYSSKYTKVKEILDKLLESDENKVLIFSGFYQEYVTSAMEEMGEKDLEILSLYDLLRIWYGDNIFVKIDGTIPIDTKTNGKASRDQIRQQFRLDPRIQIISTQGSSRLGINLTVPSIPANASIKRVYQIHLDRPDTNADVVQTIGRSKRPGQDLPLEVINLQLTNSEAPAALRYGYIDHGMEEMLQYKRLLAQMVEDGIPLTQEEEQFMGEHSTDLNIEVFPETPRSYLYRTFFRDVRGRGTKENMEYMSKIGFEGMKNAEFFADHYPMNDLQGVAGSNARVVSHIIDQYLKKNKNMRPLVGSVGAGAGILQLLLGQPVINIDMLREITETAKERLNNEGGFVVGDAAALPIKTAAFDVVDSSFMIHWTSNKQIPLFSEIGKLRGYTSERARSLQELNRVVKEGGLVTISFPASYLTPQQFDQWKNILEKDFGFELHPSFPSGLVKAVDYKTEQISWIFNLVKQREAKKEFVNFQGLSFQFEEVVKFIKASPVKRPPRQSVEVSHPLPHQEFEIIEPRDGSTKKIRYGKKPTEAKGATRNDSYLEADPVLYRWILKEVQVRHPMYNIQEVQRFAQKAFGIWMRTGVERHNINKILGELSIIINEIGGGEDSL